MVINVKHEEPDAWKLKREPLFTIEDAAGEVREYSIPVEVPGSFTLQAMEYTRATGEIEGTAWLMEQILGADAYLALRKAPGLTKTNLAAVTKVIRDKVFGDPEDEASDRGK